MKRDLVGEVDLHAYVDGELDDVRLQTVRDHLENHPADAARVEAWRRQNDSIRRAFDPVLREFAPPSLPVRPKDAAANSPAPALRLDVIRTARRRRRAVATLAAFFTGASVALVGAIAVSRVGLSADGLALNEISPATPSVQARRARLAWRTYAREVDRALDRPLGDRGQLAGALGRITALPRLPDFSTESFELLTARTMPGDSEPAAFLLYHSSVRSNLALIVERTPETDLAPALSDDGGLRCLTWRSAGYSFALVGQVDPDTLRRLARVTASSFASR